MPSFKLKGQESQHKKWKTQICYCQKTMEIRCNNKNKNNGLRCIPENQVSQYVYIQLKSEKFIRPKKLQKL